MFVICALVAASCTVVWSAKISVSVTCHSNTDCKIVESAGKIPGAYAHGTFDDDVLNSGWGKLWIHSEDSLQGSYAAGFMEGSLTSKQIFQHYKSWYAYQFPSPPSNETVQFLLDQYDYAKLLPRTISDAEYASQLDHINAQFEGLMAGFSGTTSLGPLSLIDFLLLEAAGDLYDIIPATNPSSMKLKVGTMSGKDFEEEWHRVVSCSSLIKVADDLTDVFFGHTTWTSYMNMLRVYKNYNLQGGKYQASFSSKPGVLYSKDDFYVLPRKDQMMGVMETTNGVMNPDLYKLVNPNTLLTWQRVPIAHTLATSGKEWTEIFSRYQSGTYCNQYMVIDMKKFTPGKGPAPADFLWIVEVIPGLAAASDVTQVLLSQGNYWASYNVPYTPSVYSLSGFQAAYDAYGQTYSYSNCSRAQMFRRDQASVQTDAAMGVEMRQNNYLVDPLSGGDPYLAISSRKDLRTSGASPSGGIDSKVSSYSRLSKGQASGLGLAMAQSGPTHDSLSPFRWTDYSESLQSAYVHLGQPDTFNFTFVEMDFYEN